MPLPEKNAKYHKKLRRINNENFLDTANIDETRQANSIGIIDGVNTNPDLISKEGRPFIEIIEHICETVDGPVSVEVIATTADEMIKEGRELAKIADNIAVKIPIIGE